MSNAKQHAEWLSLIEVSGPFLTLSVLNQAFQFGLDAHESDVYSSVKQAYQEWEDSDAKHIHTAWIRFLLGNVLGYPDEYIGEAQSIPESAVANLEIQGERIRPDLAILDPDDQRKVKLPILTYPRNQKLDAPVAGSSWSASPHSRMQLLLQNTGLQAGFVTNGAQWSLVHVRKGEPTGYATWQTMLLTEEKLLLQAFKGMLGVEATLGAPEGKSLFDLLDKSAQDQEEVTKELGRQVRQAVEVFINAVDRLDQDSGRTLLAGIEPKEVYNGALTVMMRLIFLLCAEERGLMDDRELYVQNYSVGALNDQLREIASGDEQVLEHRHDAWKRLLATFRLVHGGCIHENLNLPSYGGSLFDPAKYPFLEQCHIDNRVSLHLLDALEFLEIKVPGGGRERRRLSFRALGVEQIGHVYEGLLDHTAVRAKEAVVGLTGRETEEAEIALSALEANKDQIAKFFKEQKIKVSGNPEVLLQQGPNVLKVAKLRVVCGTDDELYERVLPFLNIIREDSLEHLQVYPKGSIYVASGSDRRSSGTHYTPVSLTEEVVQYALEPQVYVGPAEGLPRSEWKLKSAKEIVDLKVCDMAMGSGAFLVQACRYLSERLVEAWAIAAEQAQRPIGFSGEGHFFTKRIEGDHHAKTPGTLIETPFGSLAVADASVELISNQPEERLAQARRIIADRCLYGVDINPMAVEMAKLSLWLTTMQRERPFTFLDHVLKCGDSLIGVTEKQLENFSLKREGQRADLLLPWVQAAVKRVAEIRGQLASIPTHDEESVRRKEVLLTEAEVKLSEAKQAADQLITETFYCKLKQPHDSDRLQKIDQQLPSKLSSPDQESALTDRSVSMTLDDAAIRPFHWHLEFADVFALGGFDAIVGNPPFLGGKQISTRLGSEYQKVLCEVGDIPGIADLAVHFLRKGAMLLRSNGTIGLITTNSISEPQNCSSGLQSLRSLFEIYRANKSRPWPGGANVTISVIWLTRRPWYGDRQLDGAPVKQIPPSLSADADYAEVRKISHSYIYTAGTQLYGKGFIVPKATIGDLIEKNPGLPAYLREFVNGDVLNDTVNCRGDNLAIDFGEKDLADIVGCDQILSVLIPTVKEERKNQTRQVHETRPWLHWDKRARFFAAARQKSRILACVIHSHRHLFDYADPQSLFTHGLQLFLEEEGALFAVLQSDIHAVWSREMSSRIGGTPRYSTSTSFDTFPFPEPNQHLVEIARVMLDIRNGLRESQRVGLNELYDHFDSPEMRYSAIEEMRECQAQMNRIVVESYNWGDFSLTHEFNGEGRNRRFTISPEARKEVLRRLLRLNHERYAEEVAAGLHDKKGKKTSPGSTSKRGRKPTSSEQSHETGQFSLDDLEN